MKWFYNANISTKLIISFILVALLAGAVGVYGVYNLTKIEKADLELYENTVVPIGYLSEISTSFQKIRVEARDVVSNNDKEGIEESLGLINDYREEISTHSELFEKTIISQDCKEAYDKFVESRSNYGKVLDKFFDLARSNKDDEAYALIDGDLRVVADEEVKEIENLIELKTKHAQEQSDNNVTTTSSATNIMISIIILAMYSGPLCQDHF